jgi:hypothetical protein
MESEEGRPRFNIPKHITREHILLALKEIDEVGYPDKHASRKYDLFFNNKRYPPKYTVSLANRFVSGSILDVAEFSGGEQFTNKFLQDLDFKIIPKEEIYSDNPVVSHSWKTLSDLVATKKMDKSSFLHHGTVIPQEIRPFFSVTYLQLGNKVDVVLRFDQTRHDAYIEMTILDRPRTRLMWHADFALIIQTCYPKWYDFFRAGGVESDDTPSIQFTKQSQPNEYFVEFIESIQIQENIRIEYSQKAKRKFWWVNQNQTYSTEVKEGFLWSPQTKNNGGKNPFYDFMLEVEPGDLIFSFCDTKIKAIGIAQSKAFEYDKPFKKAGKNWTREGWKILVNFKEIPNIHQIKPSEYFEVIKGYMPKKYSPLNKNGEGCQGIYLTTISEQFAETILNLIGDEGKRIINELNGAALFNSEEVEQQQIKDLNEKSNAGEIPDTERDQLSKARIGQGKFRSSLVDLEKKCRITNVSYSDFLRASHIKPWRLSTNFERLDGNNGLLLSPHFDHLFDKGLITFSDDGDLIISSKLPREIMLLWNFSEKINVGQFREKQLGYIDFHRKFVFKQ